MYNKKMYKTCEIFYLKFLQDCCLFVSYHYLKHFFQYSDIPYNNILQIVYQHIRLVFFNLI